MGARSLYAALLAFCLYIWPAVSHSNGRNTLLAGGCPNSREGPLLPTDDTQTCPIVVDDVTAHETGSWAPWSFHPTCAYPVDESSSKYCLFTYHGFRGNASISIITTPEIAADAVALLKDPDPGWYTWNEPIAPAENGEPYELRELPGRGIGAIATRKIQRGEVILSEPAAVISMMSPPRGIIQAHRKVLAQKAYGQLGQETQELVAALTGGETGGVEGIYSTNMYTIVLAGREQHRGLFPKISVRILIVLVAEFGQTNGCAPSALIMTAGQGRD